MREEVWGTRVLLASACEFYITSFHLLLLPVKLEAMSASLNFPFLHQTQIVVISWTTHNTCIVSESI